jgi:hypothetical protein
MSVGPAVVWAPLYLTTTAAVGVANAFGAKYPLDGYGRVFQASAGVSGILAATIGAWLAYLWSRRVFGVRAAIWATLAVWLGSSAIYYSVVSPTYSHAASMLTAGIFFYTWSGTVGQQTSRRYAVLGLLGGLCALVRWQDLVFLAAPVIEIAWSMGPGEEPLLRRAKRATRHLFACAAGSLAGVLPQLAAWTIIFGSPLLVPQGGGFMRWTSPSLLAVLVSQHGLLSWTPVVALALAGCALLFRTDRLTATVVATILLFEWYTNAAVADWWAGEAYGARRFVGCFPLFVVGLAALFDRFRHRSALAPALTIVVVSANLLLLVQYQAFLKGVRDIAPYPEGLYGLWAARFVVPFKLAARLWNR